MKVTVLYNLDRGNSARQVEVASVRSGMEEKIAEVLTGKISPDLANAFPKIDIADTAIAPLLQKDVGMSNGLSLLNSGKMGFEDFGKLSKSTFNQEKIGPLLLRGAYASKVSLLEYINTVFETNITLETPVLVEGEAVPLIKVLAKYMQNAFDRDIARVQAQNALGGLKGAIPKSPTPNTMIIPPKNPPKK